MSAEPLPASTGVAGAPVKLPRIGGEFQQPAAPPKSTETHNPMFGLLVQDDGDVTGLMAYALYKQNKRDWIAAFKTAHGRDPEREETAAFIMGERIPRRIAMYRRSADDLLHRPGGSAQTPAARPPRETAASEIRDAARRPVTWRYIAFMLLLLVVMAVAFRLAATWLLRT